MATIEQIQQLLNTKSKTLANGVKAAKAQEKLVDGLEKQTTALEAQAKRDKSKVSKDAAAESGKQLKSARTKLESLSTSQNEMEETLATLNTRLRGVTEMAESRQGFVTWWQREEPKIADLADKARESAEDAEDASKKTEDAVGKGDMTAANRAKLEATVAAKKSALAAAAADKLHQSWNSTWNVQRNLRTSHLPAEDVKSYAAVTNKCYDVFKSGDKLKAAAERWATDAQRHAEVADEFAKSGGNLVVSYGALLDKTKTAMEVLAADLDKRANGLVGAYIIKEGAIYTKMLVQFRANRDGMMAAAMKAVEQGETLLPGVLKSVQTSLTKLDQVFRKAIDRIPETHHDALMVKIDAIHKIRDDAHLFAASYEDKYEKTMVPFNTLKEAVG